MERIKVAKHTNCVVFTISNPKAKNALDEMFFNDFAKALSEAENDNSVKGIIITGEDNIFSAGANLKLFQEGGGAAFAELVDIGRKYLDLLIHCHKTTIAAVNGICFGGGFELALSCDFIYASPKASFGLPEVKVGLFPGWGGTQLLSLRTGIAKAKHLILTGNFVGAEEALKIDIADKLCQENTLVNDAINFIDEISVHSAKSLEKIKELLNLRYTIPNVYEAMYREAKQLKIQLEDEETKNTVLAFLNRKK
jgi:enoyl-CoA hydratase